MHPRSNQTGRGYPPAPMDRRRLWRNVVLAQIASFTVLLAALSLGLEPERVTAGQTQAPGPSARRPPDSPAGPSPGTAVVQTITPPATGSNTAVQRGKQFVLKAQTNVVLVDVSAT